MCVDMCLLVGIRVGISKDVDDRSLVKGCATAGVNDLEHEYSTLTIIQDVSYMYIMIP